MVAIAPILNITLITSEPLTAIRSASSATVILSGIRTSRVTGALGFSKPCSRAAPAEERRPPLRLSSLLPRRLKRRSSKLSSRLPPVFLPPADLRLPGLDVLGFSSAAATLVFFSKASSGSSRVSSSTPVTTGLARAFRACSARRFSSCLRRSLSASAFF